MSEMEGDRPQTALEPEDVASWLRYHGWEQTGSLPRVASLWQRDAHEVMLPHSRGASDFALRWQELFEALSQATHMHPSSLRLEISNEGVDIAEWVARGDRDVDETIPLADGEALITSARQAIVAAANATLQRRAYFGHSLPKAAREHAKLVRMGQTRHGSYVVPIISRVPRLSSMADEEEVALFEVGEAPFERRVMRRLAESTAAIEQMAVEQETEPPPRQLNESVGAGVSHELCAAIAAATSSESVDEFAMTFSWARRFPAQDAPSAVSFPKDSAEIIGRMAEHLRGSEIIADQTIRGFVIGLRRDEEEEYGRVTLRAGTGRHRRQVSMDLNAEQYDLASEANRRRVPVEATGRLRREPGRALNMESVRHFGLAEQQLDITDVLQRYADGPTGGSDFFVWPRSHGHDA